MADANSSWMGKECLHDAFISYSRKDLAFVAVLERTLRERAAAAPQHISGHGGFHWNGIYPIRRPTSEIIKKAYRRLFSERKAQRIRQ
jgi:hypothetical protein